MKAPRKRPSNGSALIKARQSFLDEQKPVPGPLTLEETQRLHEMVEAASKSNHALIESGFRVQNLRESLVIAETEHANQRHENEKLHAAMAPLLHRLPA